MKINYFDIGLLDGKEIGWMTDIVFPELKTDYSVYGFEACRSSFEKVQQKFSTNPNVQIFNKAVSNKKEKKKLYYGIKSHQGDSLFQSKFNVHNDLFETVDCIVFSDFLKTVKDFETSFNILRFNIEGAEWYLINDIIDNRLVKNFNVFAGDEPGKDIQKVEELKKHYNEYRQLLKDNNIVIIPFAHYETQIENMCNIIKNKIKQ